MDFYSASPSNASLASKIKKPISPGSQLPSDGPTRRRLRAYQHAIVSARQAVKWGMRQLQGVFGILQVPLDENNAAARALCI